MSPKKLSRQRRKTVRRQVDRDRIAHAHKKERDWLGTIIGVSLIAAAIAMHIILHHSDTTDWFALAVAVMGGLFFDVKKITAGLRARYASNGGGLSDGSGAD